MNNLKMIQATGVAVLLIGFVLIFGVNSGVLGANLLAVADTPDAERCAELKIEWEDSSGGGWTARWQAANGNIDGHLTEPGACDVLYPEVWNSAAAAAAASDGPSSAEPADEVTESRCEELKLEWEDSSGGGWTARWEAANGNTSGHLTEPTACDSLFPEVWDVAPSVMSDPEFPVSEGVPSEERCEELKLRWEEGAFTDRFGSAIMADVLQCIDLYYTDSWNTATNEGNYEDPVFEYFETSPFPDMDVEDLEGLAAAELQRRSVINGYPDGRFGGGDPVNRAEAAKFLLGARNFDVPEVMNAGRFSDVVEGEWYVKFVITAANLGIIQGDAGEDTFRPADPVNTAEFMKMLAKTFDLAEGLPYSYDDVHAEDWFSVYAGAAETYYLFPKRIKWLAPANELSREEVAVAIYQYLANR